MVSGPISWVVQKNPGISDHGEYCGVVRTRLIIHREPEAMESNVSVVCRSLDRKELILYWCYLRCSALSKNQQRSSLWQQSVHHGLRHVCPGWPSFPRPVRVREIIVKATGRAAGQSDHTTGCTVLCTAGRRHLYCPMANEALSISESRNTPKGNGQEKTTKILKIWNYFSNHHPSFVIN